MRAAGREKPVEPLGIVLRDRTAYGRPPRQGAPPAPDPRQTVEDRKRGDAVEGVEIAEDRAEDRVDKRESLAIEPGRRKKALFGTGEFAGGLGALRLEGILLMGTVEAGNVGQDGRAELDPGSMLRPA